MLLLTDKKKIKVLTLLQFDDQVLIFLLCIVFFLFVKQTRVHLLDMEPFQNTFGKKTTRKRPKLVASDYEALVKKAAESQGIIHF